MHIHVLNKLEFEQAMKGSGLTDANVEVSGCLCAFICICDTQHPESGWSSEPYFRQDHTNVIRLWFDDVEQDTLAMYGTIEHVREVLSEMDAEALILFLEAQRDRNVQAIFVHCLAGKNRSGAVGEFANEFFGGDYQQFKKRNPRVHPNAAALSVLRKVQREKQFAI